MMATYIDKDALLHKMQERYEELMNVFGNYNYYARGFGAALELLKSAPVATDVHEDEEGKWVRMNNKEVNILAVVLLETSQHKKAGDFCLSCGALMLEDE